MVQKEKGTLAAGESQPTIAKRLSCRNNTSEDIKAGSQTKNSMMLKRLNKSN